jgi:hypothetical protein
VAECGEKKLIPISKPALYDGNLDDFSDDDDEAGENSERCSDRKTPCWRRENTAS